MERKLKVYEVDYASGMFRYNNRQSTSIYSTKELKVGDFIIVEHIGYGVFIGQVVMDVSKIDYEDCSDNEIKEELEYRYIQHVDLSEYFNEIERQERKEKLKAEMEERFKAIDKEQKFKYYAELDSDFKAMYEEYKNL